MDDIANDEVKHPPQLENTTPESLIKFTYAAVETLESYGWFIIIGVVLTIYVVQKLRPYFEKWNNQYEDYSSKKTDDPNQVFIQHESMERSRQLMQEKINQDAEKLMERKKQLDAEKRRERIEDWERHQRGQGYKSKVKKPQDEPSTDLPRKPKPKRVLRPNDYNPLMGPGGGSCYRPSSRGGQSGGG